MNGNFKALIVFTMLIICGIIIALELSNGICGIATVICSVIIAFLAFVNFILPVIEDVAKEKPDIHKGHPAKKGIRTDEAMNMNESQQTIYNIRSKEGFKRMLAQTNLIGKE